MGIIIIIIFLFFSYSQLAEFLPVSWVWNINSFINDTSEITLVLADVAFSDPSVGPWGLTG